MELRSAKGLILFHAVLLERRAWMPPINVKVKQHGGKDKSDETIFMHCLRLSLVTSTLLI